MSCKGADRESATDAHASRIRHHGRVEVRSRAYRKSSRAFGFGQASVPAETRIVVVSSVYTTTLRCRLCGRERDSTAPPKANWGFACPAGRTVLAAYRLPA